ncbi:MAG: STAS domain-containing protein [Blastocatellia bacterium]|nr:STAS domain-containing protein [Blastocatellia bacterium]
MDSSGLGELISRYTALRPLNGRIKLLHPNNHLQYLLAITKLDSLFETFDSEPAAISSFAAPSESTSADVIEATLKVSIH